MSRFRGSILLAAFLTLFMTPVAPGQQVGSIRGIVYDKDFGAPLALARVEIVETGQRVTATDEGNFVINDVAPGRYTLIFSKDGYTQLVRSDVVVSAGQLTEVSAELAGEFTEMEEFVVQDLQIGGGTEAGLLRLRLESPALIDSVSADLLSRAGASDAAGALRLVSGATVQDGKFAVIRGLPDRFVVSSLNGFRLPTADEERRAVQLDQFPAAAIESVQVTKTFTPDQQGDSSGGTVNIVTKGIPDQNILQFSTGYKYNTNVRRSGEHFLTYRGGGVEYWGRQDDGDRRIQTENLGDNWDGAVGVSRGDAPQQYSWALGGGLTHTFDNGVRIGGYGNVFYEQDASYFDDGKNNALIKPQNVDELVPERVQSQGPDDFRTALFDVEEGTDAVQWGTLLTGGLEAENHKVDVLFLYTRVTEDTATLAEDTRGKEFFFPGYDVNDPGGDPSDPTSVAQPGDPGFGNLGQNQSVAPYIRTETLEYTERTTQSLQFSGEHIFELNDDLKPELNWGAALSRASLFQPDKRQFGTTFRAAGYREGLPPFVPPFISTPVHSIFQPAANFLLGNVQRIFKEIDEDSEQYFIDVALPFDQWTENEGYVKIGVFDDSVERTFKQETFSNFNDAAARFPGTIPVPAGADLDSSFDVFWSEFFPLGNDLDPSQGGPQNHPITDGPPRVDIDSFGEQDISALYLMSDLPLFEGMNLIGGVRFEKTRLSIQNDAEDDATWFPPGANAPVELNPGDADVDFSQDDVLPSLSLIYSPIEPITFRAAYSETIARQTFRELTPIIQQEFLGGPVFIGNPDLLPAAVTNYDLRFDWVPYDGGLFSASWFYKDLEDPIEFVQRQVTFTFTTPQNFPSGEIQGFEFEARQSLGRIWEPLQGLGVGLNATFIDSEVVIPEEEQALLAAVGTPQSTRDSTGAPEYLFNLFLTYDFPATGTRAGLFYTITGESLVAGGSGVTGALVPDIYATEFDTLNLSLSQKLGDFFTLTFRARNLTDPRIQTVYRSEFAGPDRIRTSFTRGIDYSVSLSAQFNF